MGILKTFKQSLLQVKNNKFDYFFLFVQLVYFSGLVRQFGTDEFLVANLAFTGLLCFQTKKMTYKDLKIAGIIFAVFVIITLIPTVIWGVSTRLFLGYSGRIVLGMLIIIYFKNNFFEVFENLVFALAFISLPLFILQLAYVDIFSILQPISDTFLGGSRLNPSGYEDIYTTHQYGFIFLVNQWALFRNSGFMWEPAAFGAVLTWAMVFNSYLNRFEFNTRLIVFVLACLTTFSIGTYIYLSILIFIFLSHKLTFKKLVYVTVFAVVIIFSLSRTELVSRNADMIVEKLETEQRVSSALQSRSAPAQDLSRVGALVVNTEKVIDMPIGYGLHQTYREFPGSPNGLITLMRNWGLIALFILIVCVFKMIRKLNQRYEIHTNAVLSLLLICVILLPLAGNPFYNQPFLFAFLFSGFLVINQKN